MRGGGGKGENMFNYLGIKNSKGWIRVWIVSSIFWTSATTLYEFLNWSGTKYNHAPELFKAYAIVLGPPIAIPIIVIAFLFISKWISDGFNQ